MTEKDIVWYQQKALLVLGLGLLFAGLILAYQDSIKFQQLKSFLAEKYNFTEEECVEHVLGDKVKSSVFNDTHYSEKFRVTVIGTRNLICYAMNLTAIDNEGFALGVRIDCFEDKGCLRYCHTTQVKEGEECRTKEKEITGWHFIWINASDTIVNIDNTMKINFSIDYPPILIYGGNRTFFTERKYNVTICTPKFRNESCGCQSGEDVREARKIMK